MKKEKKKACSAKIRHSLPLSRKKMFISLLSFMSPCRVLALLRRQSGRREGKREQRGARNRAGAELERGYREEVRGWRGVRKIRGRGG